MSEEVIFKYLTYFKKLNRGYSKNLGRAPHKPVLLLSVIQLIAKGIITTNKIFIDSDLILAFQNNWKLLVDTRHTSNFALPFFHLRSEPFWRLVTKPGSKLSLTSSKSIKSFNSLNESVAFAEIDKDLFYLLLLPENQLWFEQLLIDFYFPNVRSYYKRPEKYSEEIEIENEILNEPKEKYQAHLIDLKSKLEDNQFEEEIFIRGSLFKKTVPKIYDFTCCISGLKITSTHNVQMVDACHIYPFSLSNDDTVSNGIALSPTLHRAFDRGLITINSNYVVRVSPSIQNENTNYSLTKFEGKQILLPENEKWYPSQESLNWHNKETFLL
ncbi:MAG TPA: HNH endonuclease [Salegentibacter sp.]|uniref:HNH endonuclease n=1 Tax=Salegentibacter sp. TaxID=1903072 RepID=UPI002F925B0E